MAISPEYPYDEIRIDEAMKLIINAEDKSEKQIKTDEGTWKERTIESRMWSDSLNLIATSTFQYDIHENTTEEPWSAMPCVGIVKIVENLN